MLVNFGGAQLSCSDSNLSSLVIFLRGCPYRCFYCQNKEIIDGNDERSMEEMNLLIQKSRGLISEVVLSGGEPMMQPGAIEYIAKFTKGLNLKLGIETSGYNSGKLLNLIKNKLINEVFLDIKTYGNENYHKLTGNDWAWDNVLNVIHICDNYKIPLELRTTVSQNYPTPKDLEKIELLAQKHNLHWKKQEALN
ncbi:MAG: anaerobic ribonucleoside-triphosphate reductase activating protein [Acidobacteria bacterium]|nr:anaerobic ribonucleoside-triphosphate reductase activating protein [Acidobacteriota bacterium]